MSWLDALPQYLLVTLILVLPGLWLTFTLNLRGLLRAATAVPLTVAGMAASAVIFGLTGIPWTPLTVAVAFLVVGVLFWAVLLPVRKRHTRVRLSRIRWEALRERATTRAIALGCAFVVGAGLIADRLVLILGTPDAISQTYDATFHYNALQYIHDTGNASSLTLGGLGVTPQPSFYPAAWHNAAAMVAIVTEFSPLVIANAMTFVLCALVWTLGCLYFATRLFGGRPLITVSTGLVAASFPAFPFLLSFYGNLFPNTMSIAFLPVLLGMLTEALGLSYDPRVQARAPLWLGILVVTCAIGLAHPSSVLLALLILLIMLLTVWWRALVGHHPWWLVVAGGLALVVGAYALQRIWFAARASPEALSWSPHAKASGALGEALGPVFPNALHVPWGLVIVTLLGAFVVLRSRARWVVGAWALMVWLYVLVASSRNTALRYDWTGIWYNDANRLLALLPLVAVPLAAAGCAAIVAWLARGLLRMVDRVSPGPRSGDGHEDVARTGPARTLRDSRLAGAAGGALLVLIGFLALQGAAMSEVVGYGRTEYGMEGRTPLLTPDEQALIERLPQEVPDDAVVFGNPVTGTSLAYAIADVAVLIPHNGLIADSDVSTIVHHLEDLRTDPDVCPALEKHDVRYVLDFGKEQVNPFAYFDAEGSDEIGPANGFTLIDQQGPHAKLYEITGCD